MSGVKGRSGRPKGSLNKKTTEGTSNRKEEYQAGEVVEGIVQQVIPVKKKITYWFQYVPDDGSTFWAPVGRGESQEIKSQEVFECSEYTRNMILQSEAYREGKVVPVDADNVDKALPNSLSDRQLENMFNKGLDFVKNHIKEMDSIFAIRRLKQYATVNDKPSSVVKTCELRIAELEEEEESKSVAPVLDEKGNIVNLRR